MKRFIRTFAGKCVLFILCILSVCILAGSLCGTARMAMDGGQFYTHTWQEIQGEFMSGQLRSLGYDYVWSTANGYPPFDSPWLVAEVLGEDGESVYRTDGADGVSVWQYSFTYGVQKDKEGNITDTYYLEESNHDTSEQYKVNLSLKDSGSAVNPYLLQAKLIRIAWLLRYAVYGIILASLVCGIVSFVALMKTAGRRPDTEEIFPGPLNRVPFDILAAGWLLVGTAVLGLCCSIENFAMLILGCVSCPVLLALFLGLCTSAAVRLKQHTLLQNTVLCRCLKLLRKTLHRIRKLLLGILRFFSAICGGLPLVWQIGLALLALSLVEFIAICFLWRHNIEWLVLLFALEKLVLIPAALYLALCLRRLQKGGQALAAGDLAYITNTERMPGALREHGENLNSIAGGMAIAVEERLKSERMKTELITNVSHDIKTPLTSIINYADLIGKEPCENGNITEYAQVLLRQSERLKRLIDDLVEASKASTGNLDIRPMPCDASIFLTQAAGEYEEKLRQAGLTLVTTQPEEEIRIMADGRRMWRIFDNLMNNICKYAQSGTRVYLSLNRSGKDAVITFKNTSRDPLNMTEEELMERFARGDTSRNTEGNGLGLSIAKSLAELHGGSLTLTIDGDLFKAILRFPAI